MRRDRLAAVGRFTSCYRWVRGLRMHARVPCSPPAHDGPPVVLVHGLLVSSRYMLPTAKLLAPIVPVYAPDLPSYGLSGHPPHALDVAELADVLVEWLDAMGLERAVLVANSFGCQVVVDLAMRYPERVERLALLGPTTDPAGRTVLVLAGRWIVNLLHEPLGLYLVALRDLLDIGIPRTVQTLGYMVRDHIEEKLPFVQAPTLVVRGEYDTAVPQHWCERVTCLLPHARLAVIPHAAHTINYNSPERVARLILGFLAEQAPNQGVA